jgi:DNA-binding transcriptional MocR family regulator
MATSAPLQIDLARAVPPVPPRLEEAYRSVLAGMVQEGDIGRRIRVNRPGGNGEDRKAAALWLSHRLGFSPNPGQAVLANGTQSLLGLLLYAVVGASQTLLAEELTYPVLGPLAARFGVNVVPVAIDDDGIIPQAFDEACRRHAPKALFCNPTVQNPTTSVMSLARRRLVVEVARHHSLTIIEDDVLGPLHPAAPPPIAALDSGRVWYLQSLSKCLSLGLKIALMVAPSPQAARTLLAPVENQSFWFPSALSAEIARRMILGGHLAEIATEIAAIARHRRSMLARHLGADIVDDRGGLHVWLRLPDEIPAKGLVEALDVRGIHIRPAAMFAVSASTVPPNAVRIALTTALRDENFETAATCLAQRLSA